MRAAGVSCALALLAAAARAAPAPPHAPTPFERADVRAIGERIACTCGCPHTAVSSCYCGEADRVRDWIASELDGGKSADQVVADYTAEHGTWSLTTPPRRGFNWILWIGPAALLTGGTAVVLALGRRWSAAGAPVPSQAGSIAPSDPERLRRLRELEAEVREDGGR